MPFGSFELWVLTCSAVVMVCFVCIRIAVLECCGDSGAPGATGVACVDEDRVWGGREDVAFYLGDLAFLCHCRSKGRFVTIKLE